MKFLEDSELTERDKRLLAHGQGNYTCPARLPDGGLACITRRGFNWTIISDLDDSGYADLWCYNHPADAMLALMQWSGQDGTEPDGWFRHPPSGRRREDGDPAKQYVNL